MPLEPGYGETPVDPDDLAALTPTGLDLLGSEPTRFALFDLEQAIEETLSESMHQRILEGELQLDELITDSFLRELHAALYSDIWSWAGRFRKREVSIGVAPEQVAAELRGSLDSILFRWEHTDDWDARQLGVAVHAETVRIHPFVDGNGRTTRLLADLVFLAAQNGSGLAAYDWDVDKERYIALLREYDRTRDAAPLAKFIGTVPIA